MEPIILASGSLRRQEFFRLLGLPFSIMPALIDENYEDAADPRGLAENMALKKVNKILSLLKSGTPPWICGADTIISVGGIIFGKPKDRNDAKRMLMALQGREHDVVTAIALYNGRNRSIDSRTVVSTVTFAPLSEGELEWYLSIGEWQGMAGAYKIQGLASCYVSEINGSYSSIVGLPIREFYVMLRENGYPYGGGQ
ncbi:MAG: Maf family protein [Treponema sp.]|jgi:septum formation protein|nr:Maf family protein [Treponema sp.]